MAMSVPVNVHEEYGGETAEEGVYIAITGETEDFYSNKGIYTMLLSLCMTAKPWPYIISILSRHTMLYAEGEDFQVAALEGFTQYAVEEGIIEDTVEQRAAITKAVVRASSN